MKVNTTRFGVLEVDEGSIVKMVKGPLGFEDRKEFVLIKHRPDTQFHWLQSTEEPGLAFVVMDPSLIATDYDLEISDAEAQALHLTDEADALILAIVTVSEGAAEITANLAGPVIINSKELIGAQIILQDSRYPVRYPISAGAENETGKKTALKAAS